MIIRNNTNVLLLYHCQMLDIFIPRMKEFPYLKTTAHSEIVFMYELLLAMAIEKFPYVFKKIVKSSVALVKRNQISAWLMKKSFQENLNCFNLTNFFSKFHRKYQIGRGQPCDAYVFRRPSWLLAIRDELKFIGSG